LWRRPRRFGRRIDPAPAQALTLQFGLHLNLTLNMAAGTHPTPERTAGDPAGTPRGLTSARSVDASPRTQAPALQFGHRLNVLLSMMTDTRQMLQQIASVLPSGTRAGAAFDSGPRYQAATRLNSWRDTLRGIAAPEDTPRRFAMATRTLERALAGPARVSGGIAPAESQLADRRDRSRPFARPGARQAASWPAARRAARRPTAETRHRLFGRPAESIALIQYGRRTPEAITPITLAWRRAPNGALAQDAHAAPSAGMVARTNAAHAVMPATSPRDMPSALNARMPRQAGTQFDSAMMNRLTHEVIGRIEQKMRVERERRGL
jgi:hypothetical protein